MKVQCPQCREIVEMVDFSTSAEGLRFTCGNCQKDNFLASPRTVKPAPETEPPPEALAGEVICPKCGHSQKDPFACHRCGLVFDKFDRSKLPPDPPEAAELWKEVQLLPADDARHQAFLDACLKADRLDYAARQYHLLQQDPSQKAVAERMLDQLFKKAQAKLGPAALAAAEGGRTRERKKSKIVVWIVLAVCGGLLLYYIITMTDMLNRLSP